MKQDDSKRLLWELADDLERQLPIPEPTRP